MKIPTRCRNCAQWLGHLSGNEEDPRCNREWGHDERWGHFYDLQFRDEPYGHPAFVKHDCTVLKWGIPLPMLDEHGNEIGPAVPSARVDAYIPLKPLEGDGLERSIPVEFVTPYGTFTITSSELREYLMAKSAKDKKNVADLFAARSKNREEIQRRHAKTYNELYGTTPRVLQGSEALPPYQRGLERVPTGLAPLDIALKGGIPVGCRINISGYPDSGKSTLIDCIEGAFLRYYRANSQYPESEKIGMIKPEGFELEYMIKAMNLSNDPAEAKEIFNTNVDIIATNFAEESTQYVISALNQDNLDTGEFRGPDVYSYMLPITYRLFTFDSIDAEELAEESFGKNRAEKVMGENARIAGGARMLSEFFRKAYKAAKIPTTLILVSQHRTANIQTMAKTSYHRGKAHPFFTLLELNTYSPKMKENDVTQLIKIKFGKVHIDANIQRDDEIELHLRPGEGFTVKDNVVAAAFQQGIVVPAGAWVSYAAKDGRLLKSQGSNIGRVADWLEREGLIDEVYDRVMETAANSWSPLREVIEDEPEDQEETSEE